MDASQKGESAQTNSRQEVYKIQTLSESSLSISQVKVQNEVGYKWV